MNHFILTLAHPSDDVILNFPSGVQLQRNDCFGILEKKVELVREWGREGRREGEKRVDGGEEPREKEKEVGGARERKKWVE